MNSQEPTVSPQCASRTRCVAIAAWAAIAILTVVSFYVPLVYDSSVGDTTFLRLALDSDVCYAELVSFEDRQDLESWAQYEAPWGSVIPVGLAAVDLAHEVVTGPYPPPETKEWLEVIAQHDFSWRYVCFPLWTVLLVLGVLPVFAVIRGPIRRRRRRRKGECLRCGYQLRGNTSGICPECGMPTAQRPRSGTLRMGVWGLAVCAVSILLCWIGTGHGYQALGHPEEEFLEWCMQVARRGSKARIASVPEETIIETAVNVIYRAIDPPPSYFPSSEYTAGASCTLIDPELHRFEVTCFGPPHWGTPGDAAIWRVIIQIEDNTPYSRCGDSSFGLRPVFVSVGGVVILDDRREGEPVTFLRSPSQSHSLSPACKESLFVPRNPEPAVKSDGVIPSVFSPDGQKLTLDLGRGVRMEFVRIPAGSFIMGSGMSKAGRDSDERPQRRVTITKPFYMGVTEVTQEQYAAIMGKKPTLFSGPQNPVEAVSWNDAVAFCKALSTRADKQLRLPTEAEWEYACRAGTKTRYSFGDDAKAASMYAWYGRNSGGETHPVGQKKPNAWGLFDMHGNVYEWCADWHSDDYTNAETIDPRGPQTGRARVLRGGSWGGIPDRCRSANRHRNEPDMHCYLCGFRVVSGAVD